jgi:hypothetical protein
MGFDMHLIPDPAGDRPDDASGRHPLPGNHPTPQEEDEPAAPLGDDVRERVLDELRREQALEEFKESRPDFWMQVERLKRIIDHQERQPDNCFAKGACFVHVNLPDVSSLTLRRIDDIDLQSCLASIEIYEDDDLAAGTVLVPLEGISWFGFPEHHVANSFAFQGFTSGLIQRRDELPVIVPEPEARAESPDDQPPSPQSPEPSPDV